jgi:hypothetical protein
MAALSTTMPTLLDLAKLQAPGDKGLLEVAEILTATNAVLKDMTFKEGNLTTGELTGVRTGLPTPTMRKFNEGVSTTKGNTAQLTFETAMMEDYGEVDKALADLGGNSMAFRAKEDYAHIEGMSQKMASLVFYGNSNTAPEEFLGLSNFYSDPSAASGENIINGGAAGGQTDVASIWLVGWGEVTLEAAGGVAGKRMQAYRSHYKWDAGMALADWRYNIRIANIDKSTLSVVWTNGAFSTGANLPDLMFQAIEQLPESLGDVRLAF